MRNSDLSRLSACDALAALSSGQISSRDLVDALLRRIAERDDAVGAFASLDAAKVRAAADAADLARATSQTAGALLGLPVAIKDIIDTVDYPTENGTPVFAGRQPDQDAFVVAQLKPPAPSFSARR